MKATELTEIEENPETIVRGIGAEAVSVYTFLAREFGKGSVVTNHVFQFLYRSFYRLDNAGLTPQFKSRYFVLLDECRDSPSIALEHLTRELYEHANLKGQQSLQFSFVTKLANTANREYPIYDAEIARVFGFRTPYNYKPFENRLSEYMTFYEGLRKLYGGILRDNKLAKARALFHKIYRTSPQVVPEVKVLDFIFWSAGKLSREAEERSRAED